jgi:hypothetical protein
VSWRSAFSERADLAGFRTEEPVASRVLTVGEPAATGGRGTAGALKQPDDFPASRYQSAAGEWRAGSASGKSSRSRGDRWNHFGGESEPVVLVMSYRHLHGSGLFGQLNYV